VWQCTISPETAKRNIVIMKSITKHRTKQNLRDNHRHKQKKSWQWLSTIVKHII